MYDELTNEAKYFLLQLYKTYLESVDNNYSRDKSRQFGNIDDLQRLMPNSKLEDIKSYANELVHQNYCEAVYASDTIKRYQLLNRGITKMQNRTKDNLKNIYKAIKDLSSFIPGL